MAGLRREVVEHGASGLPKWVGEVDRSEVQISTAGLEIALERRYGDNVEAKIVFLQRLKERVKAGLEKLSPAQAVALTEVLSNLVLNSKVVGADLK